MARVTYKDITIGWGGGLGVYGWCCGAWVNGRHVHMMFVEYPKKEALRLFHSYVNQIAKESR